MIAAMVTGPTLANAQQIQRQHVVQHDSESAAQAATTEYQLVLTDQEELARTLETSPRFARYRFSAEAITSGRIVAVQGSRTDVVSAANFADKIAADAIFVENVRPTMIRTAAPGSLSTGEVNSSDYKLTFQVTALNASTNQPVKLDAWARDSTGLSVDGTRSVYAGNFHVALTNVSDPGDQSTLASPVAVAITARGATSIEPRPLVITKLAQWHDVSITVPSVEGLSYPIAVSADPSQPGDTVELSVIRPTIRLWSTPNSIVGWGIGQGIINVAATGMQHTEGFRVPLTSIHGSLDSGNAILDAGGHGAVRLRSSQDNATTIEVPNSVMISDPLEVKFDAPWLFLGAAIAGGLIGAFLRGRGRQHWARAGAIGAASALVMTLAYAVGIDWPARVLDSAGIARAGEAVVFVLGALGALLGVSWLVPGGAKPANGGD